MCVGAWVNAWNTFQYPSHRANASEMGEGFKSAAEYIFVPHSRRVYLAMINLQWSPRNSCQARAVNVQFTAIEAMQNAGTVNIHESWPSGSCIFQGFTDSVRVLYMQTPLSSVARATVVNCKQFANCLILRIGHRDKSRTSTVCTTFKYCMRRLTSSGKPWMDESRAIYDEGRREVGSDAARPPLSSCWPHVSPVLSLCIWHR